MQQQHQQQHGNRNKRRRRQVSRDVSCFAERMFFQYNMSSFVIVFEHVGHRFLRATCTCRSAATIVATSVIAFCLKQVAQHRQKQNCAPLLPNNLSVSITAALHAFFSKAGGPESVKNKLRATAQRQVRNNLPACITVLVHAFCPKQVAKHRQKQNCAPPRTDNCRTTFPRILLQPFTLFSRKQVVPNL